VWVGEETDRSNNRWSSGIVVVVALDEVVDTVDGDMGVSAGMVSPIMVEVVLVLLD